MESEVKPIFIEILMTRLKSGDLTDLRNKIMSSTVNKIMQTSLFPIPK